MSFEQTFFGPGNRLRWEAIQSGALSQDTRDRLGPFLDELRVNSNVFTLPRVLDDGRVQWYILCDSARSARIARDQLLAFLGPSYSSFDGRPAVLDPNDSIDAAVLDRYGRNVFRLDLPQRDLRDRARERLALMVNLRKERPQLASAHPRPVGRLLRDFEYALLTGNDDEARALVGQVKSEGHLSATNILFLEVRRLAASRHWDAIMALPELDGLVSMPRPKRVTEALVQAIYETRLRDCERAGRPEEAVARFRAEIYPRFQELYKSRATLKGDAVDASFILAAGAAAPPRTTLVSEVLDVWAPATPEGTYLATLARFVPGRQDVHENPLSIAKRAFADAEVDEAFALATPLPPSFERTALLLRCARDIGTISAARVALGSIDLLKPSDHDRLGRSGPLVRIKEALDRFRAEEEVPREVVASDDLPSDWSTWLKRLMDPQPWTGAVSAAETGAREWDFEALVSDHSAVDDLARLLLEVPTGWGTAALRDSLPYVLEFCVRAGAERRLKPVYESLFLLIATDEQMSLPQVAALLAVVDVRLHLGVSSHEYSDITRQLAIAIRAVSSPAIAEVALNAIEVLVNSMCPSESDRQGFVAEVGSVFQRWRRRIGRDQIVLLQLIAEEVGVPLEMHSEGSEQETGGQTEWATLRGLRVALYSLQESALRRAVTVLSSLCPEVRVDAHQDHVGSQALKAASSGADIFVIATAAAKHAATTFIEANRPKHLTTLYARGQGSSSLLEALRSYLKAGVRL